MKNKIVPMLGLAAVFGSLSIFVANFWLESAADARAPEPAPVQVSEAQLSVEFGTIVVAREPLRYGAPVSAAVLSEIPWPKDSMPDGAFATIKDLMKAGDRVVLSAVETNEPMLLAKLSGVDGRATLSNRLTPGMQAVTIQTDEFAGVGGFVTPGDRVDVVLTRNGGQAVSETLGGDRAKPLPGSEMISETVAAQVKVLSVGQGSDDRATEANVARSVTLEVTPADARKLTLARSIGQLSLSLLSTTGARDVDGSPATLSSITGLITAAASAITPQMPEQKAEPAFAEVKVTRGIVGEVYKVPTLETAGDAAAR